jgi:hypothetical protein
MQPIEINRNSWHYKFVRKAYGYMEYNNICEYSRGVIYAILGTLLISVVLCGFSGIMLFVLADFLAWLFAMIVMKEFLDGGIGPAFFILGAMIYTPLAIYHLWSDKNLSEKLDIPVVSAAYKAWKEKFCVKVVIK